LLVVSCFGVEQCDEGDKQCGATEGLAMLQRRQLTSKMHVDIDSEDGAASAGSGETSEPCDENQHDLSGALEVNETSDAYEELLEDDSDYYAGGKGDHVETLFTKGLTRYAGMIEEEGEDLGEDEEDESLAEADAVAVQKQSRATLSTRGRAQGPGIKSGIVPDHPDLMFVKTGGHWIHRTCCDGHRISKGRAPGARVGRRGWYSGGEPGCAKLAAEQEDKGVGAFMIGRRGECLLLQRNRCHVRQRCGRGWHWGSGYDLQRARFPRVDGISPKAGGLAGGTVVTVVGEYLWAGRRKPSDVQDFAPPITICLQNQPCEIDYFSSSAETVKCRVAPYKKAPEVGENLTDPDLQNSLTLSDNLCAQIEKQVPGGYVFNKTEFVKVPPGHCSSNKLHYRHRVSGTEACKKLAVQYGGKAFLVRKNTWRGRRDCTIYADYCSRPRGFRGNNHYESMSLFPPTPAVFVKHHGEFVGGLVNQKWNKLSKCGDSMDACSFDYDDKKSGEGSISAPSICITWGQGYNCR
jgi:hypothetical protein